MSPLLEKVKKNNTPCQHEDLELETNEYQFSSQREM